MNAEFNHLIVFGRRPALGFGKRRLAAEIGNLDAWRFQRHALNHLTHTLGADPRWRLWRCLTPDTPASQRPADELPQGRGDLGARLAFALKRAPSGRVVIIGSDAPQVRRADIAAAFAALARADAVIGPARDGGFWLIGLSARLRHSPPFSNVRWSSAHTLSDVLANLRGRPRFFLRELEDVDDAASLARVRAHMRHKR
ncbi:MAG: DUF2064 domain-containing protein [Hyphomonadaceae bacterium]